MALVRMSHADKAEGGSPVARSVVEAVSPEVPTSPARAGRNRGTWEGVLSAASFRI
jgi:hypothetical protein